jgi:UDP-GlcNAc:undecaprenyl-phosphate GlcNAc-1-phosphate transferase
VVVCGIFPFILSFILTPLSIKLAPHIGAIDIPKDNRRMHKTAKPRCGGLAIFISTIAILILIRTFLYKYYPASTVNSEYLSDLIAVIIGGTLIFFVGLLDDIKELQAIPKFLLQIACASVTFALGVRMPAINMLGLHFSPDSVGGVILSYVFTMGWIVVITNTINLIDGMDGLAAGVAAIAAVSIAYAAYIHGQYTVTFAMMALAGSAFGFLPFNFFPAKTFMGDEGALFLGFMIASTSIIEPAKGATLVATLVPLIVLGVPIFDVVFAVFRRKAKGKHIFEADKEHIHHQLARIGMGQRRSVMMIYGISAIMGIAAVMLSRQLYVESVLLFITAFLFIVSLIWGWNNGKK